MRSGLDLRALRTLLVALALALAASPAPAQDSTNQDTTRREAPAAATARDKEVDEAYDAALEKATKGPADVPMLDQATLHLPQGYLFVPREPANRLMRAFGNTAGDESFAGLVLPPRGDPFWFITASYVKAGFVQDGEAKSWDVDGLLKSITEGTQADNEDRVARGFPRVKVIGWAERPSYDAATHRLVYSTALADEDAQPSDEQSVNYNTYALGREGYFQLDLVTGSNSVESQKVHARTVLAALEYKSGKRYEDFSPSTDRIAEYGITALVAGVAAKKLGLLALFGVAIAKFGKLIALGALALFGGIGSLFRRRKT